MKPYVLLGIDKYRNKRLICIVNAGDLTEAAAKLGGTVRDTMIVASGSPFQLYVDAGQECAVFTFGNCTDEVLAKAAAADRDETQRLIAYYRYGTDHIYREYVLGTVPVMP